MMRVRQRLFPMGLGQLRPAAQHQRGQLRRDGNDSRIESNVCEIGRVTGGPIRTGE